MTKQSVTIKVYMYMWFGL